MSFTVRKISSVIISSIFGLNEEKPELFQQSGISVSLSISHSDDYCLFHTTLPALPRRFATINFYFVKAKLGYESFWVRDISYKLGEQPTIQVSLDGGFLNRYREFLLEKALFRNGLSRHALSDMYDFQVDDWLNGFDR